MQALSHTIYSTCSTPTLGATTGPLQREVSILTRVYVLFSQGETTVHQVGQENLIDNNKFSERDELFLSRRTPPDVKEPMIGPGVGKLQIR
jgi:hypothetical protein